MLIRFSAGQITSSTLYTLFGCWAAERLAEKLHKGMIMAKGTVKWFNHTKGFGFIEPEDGGKDAFVHISAVERAGLSGLNEGQKVSFELVSGRDGKMAAENLSTED